MSLSLFLPDVKVATYDLQPEMSAIPVAECVARRVRAKEHGFVIWYFAFLSD